MLGGPVMNLVIAFVLHGDRAGRLRRCPRYTPDVSGVSQCVIPADDDPTRECTDADPAAPAAAAGIEPGDTVVSYDGTEITSWEQLSGLIRGHGRGGGPGRRRARRCSWST